MSVVADWCAAHGLDAAEVDATLLDYFASEVSLGRTRFAQSVAHLRRRGATLPRHPPATALGRGGDQLAAVEAIARCPISGRLGVRGRRDALVLALLDAGLNRTQVAGLRPDDVDIWRIGGRELVAGDDERTCPRCVLARWLVVRAELPPLGSRAGAVHTTMIGLAGHLCTSEVEPASATPGALLPALDQHGWPSMSNIGPRAITSVVTARSHPDIPEPANVTTPTFRPSVDVLEIRREMDQLLDELDGRLEQIEAARPGVTRHGWWG